jgi:hypothetical protein
MKDPEKFALVLGRPDHGVVWEVTTYYKFKWNDDSTPPVAESTSCRLKSVRIDGGHQVTNCLHGYLHLLNVSCRPPVATEVEWVAKTYLSQYGSAARWDLIGCGRHEDEWIRRLLQRPPGLGASVIKWGLAGLTLEQVSATYGDGRKLYVTAPIADDGVTILRGPGETSDADMARREAFLEQAVEDGQLAGASPAD